MSCDRLRTVTPLPDGTIRLELCKSDGDVHVHVNRILPGDTDPAALDAAEDDMLPGLQAALDAAKANPPSDRRSPPTPAQPRR